MSLSLKKIIYGLLALSAGLLLVYIYLANSSIIKLVEKRNEENIIKTVSSQLAFLEGDYMRLMAGLNMDLAKRLGFESVSKVEFVPGRNVNQGLSLRVNAEI